MKRLFKYTDLEMQDALRSFAYTNKERKVIADEILKKNFVAEDSEESIALDVIQKIEDLAGIICNNGFDRETRKFVDFEEMNKRLTDLGRNEYTLADGTKKSILVDGSTSSLGFFIQQTITRVISKVNEPELQAWMLVSKDLYLEDGTTIYNVVVESEGNEATTRVAEGGSFKTLQLASSEDYIKTNKGKVGIYVEYFDEAMKANGPQVIKMIVEAALSDMKRFKTREAIQLLEVHAKNYYDGLNVAGTGSAGINLPAPSGTKFTDPKKRNGGLLFGDLTDFLHKAQTFGFDIDTIFIHPLAYGVFYNEPNVREYLKETANVLFLVPKKRRTVAQNLLTKLSKVRTANAAVYEEEVFDVPQIITNKKLNIVVTPLVSFFAPKSMIPTPESRFSQTPTQWYANSGDVPVTDILLIDSNRALTYVHSGKGITSDKVEERLTDVTKIKFVERYQFLLDKDHGVFAFRNIPVTNDIFDPFAPVNVVLNHKDIHPTQP